MKLFTKSLLLLVVTAALTLAQTGTRMVGFDAKSMGRGGTSIGTFDSPVLMMTNPAGISFLNNSSLDLNISLMYPTLHFKNNLNNADGDKNIFPLPGASYVNRSESDFTWGIGFFTAGGMGADFKMKHALYGATLQDYHSKLASMQGGISAAYKLTENFSVGVSAHLVYSMLEFSMPYSMNPMMMNGTAMPGMTFGMMFAAPASMGGFGYDEVTAAAKMTDLTAIGFNGKIGFAYKVDDKLSFGLSYTMPTSLTYTNGKASMDMTAQLNDAFGKAVQAAMMQGYTQAQAQAAVMAQFTGLGINMAAGVQANYDLDVDLKSPQSIGFGVAYSASDDLRLSADIEWMNWEGAYDKMTLKLSEGSSANVNKIMGASAFNIDFPMNWKDVVLVKLGGEYCATKDLTLRLGYAFGSNPVPQTTIFPVFPAVVENHITAGASYKVSGSVMLHAAYEMALNNSVSASSTSLIAKEYNSSTSDLSTWLFHMGMSYAF